jgi:hypothetical protein
MRKKHRLGLILATTSALAAAIGGPSAFAGAEAAQDEPVTITMKLSGKSLKFVGPDQVAAGQKLRVLNATKPRKVGPHTFTLVQERLLPNTRKERKTCFSPGNVCMDVAVAHKFNPRTEKVNQPVVTAGSKGWDTEFTSRAKGDSWYTEKLGQGFTRGVSAKPGTVLHYLCVIHPEMQGEIEVVAGP